MNILSKIYLISGALLCFSTNTYANTSEIGKTSFNNNISNYQAPYQIAKAVWLPDYKDDNLKFEIKTPPPTNPQPDPDSTCDITYFNLESKIPNAICTKCTDTKNRYHCDCDLKVFQYDKSNCINGTLGTETCGGKANKCICPEGTAYNPETFYCEKQTPECNPEIFKYDESNCKGGTLGGDQCGGKHTKCICQSLERYDSQTGSCKIEIYNNPATPNNNCTSLTYQYDDSNCLLSNHKTLKFTCKDQYGKLRGKECVCMSGYSPYPGTSMCVKDIQNKPLDPCPGGQVVNNKCCICEGASGSTMPTLVGNQDKDKYGGSTFLHHCTSGTLVCK